MFGPWKAVYERYRQWYVSLVGGLRRAGLLDSTPVNEADDAPVAGVSLFLHGDSEAAAHAALAVTDALKVRAVETGSGDFLTADSARSAMDTRRAYRDRVLGERKV
jgi:hypothetical protein